MSEIREVRQYGWRGYVSRELRRDSAIDVDRMLQADLERSAQAEGYVILPGTFQLQYLEPVDAADPTDPDVIFAHERDMLIVFTSLRCYAKETV